MSLLEEISQEQIRTDIPELAAGDTVKVSARVVEGTRERVQVFEGVVIALKGKVGLATSFTVRRIAHGVGVERTFLVHAPRIDKIEVLRHGQVRRAKLFYLREKVGRHARIRERRQPIGGSEMTLLRAEPDAVHESDVEPEELIDAADEPELDGTAPAEVTPETDEPEGAAATSESDGGA